MCQVQSVQNYEPVSYTHLFFLHHLQGELVGMLQMKLHEKNGFSDISFKSGFINIEMLLVDLALVFRHYFIGRGQDHQLSSQLMRRGTQPPVLAVIVKNKMKAIRIVDPVFEIEFSEAAGGFADIFR